MSKYSAFVINSSSWNLLRWVFKRWQWCWWLNDGDHFKMLVTKKYVGDIFQHVVLIRKPNKLWETLMHSGSYFDKLEFLQTVSANFVPASNLAYYSKLWRWFQEYWLPMIKWLMYRCIWTVLNHLLAGYLRFHNDPFIWMKKPEVWPEIDMKI